MKKKEEIQDLLIQIEDNLRILKNKQSKPEELDTHVRFNDFKQEILALAWRDALYWVAEGDFEEEFQEEETERELSLADYAVSKKERRN